jgi:hypothetical protein
VAFDRYAPLGSGRQLPLAIAVGKLGSAAE